MTDRTRPTGRPALPKVLWLIKTLDLGGAERLLTTMAKVRNRQAFDYEAAYVLADKALLVPELEAEGIPVHCLQGGRNLDLRWTWRLRELLSSRRFAIVHTHLRYTASMGRLVVRSLPRGIRPRLVCTEHVPWERANPISELANRLTYPLDDAGVAVSNAVWRSIPPKHRAKTEMVVHGLDLEEARRLVPCRSEVRRELGVGASEVLIVAIANFRPQKGYDVLLPAAALLVDEGLPVRFVVLGSGPLAKEIEERRDRLGLGERFKLLGTRRDALRVLSGADLFVLASHYEGFPVAIMEALAMGVPVVATAVGGVPEAVRDGAEGFVVPPGRMEPLAIAMRTLVVDPGLRATMAAASLERGQFFDIRRAARRIEQIYDMVLTG